MLSSRRCPALDDEEDDDEDEDEDDEAKNAARPDADAMHDATCALMKEGRIMSEHAGHWTVSGPWLDDEELLLLLLLLKRGESNDGDKDTLECAAEALGF
jgi:hypothetical protein